MKIFIDFDDVLFDTRSFKTDFQKIFLQFGITADIFAENYYNYLPNKKNSSIRTYNLEKHLRAIEKIKSFGKPALKKNILDFVNDTRRYVFPDVKLFFQKFSRKELILISHGDRNFQRKKIKNTQLEKYFSAIKISSGQKSKEIFPLIKKMKEKKFFLDDRVHYLEEVKKRFPEIMTILIQRLEGRYQDQKNNYCDFTAKNLKAALRIIDRIMNHES